MTNINSLENKKIKEIVKLRKAGTRKDKGVFLIDGKREIELAFKSGVDIQEIFYCPDFSPEYPSLLKKVPENKLIIVSKLVFQKISYKESPDGFLAIASYQNYCLDDVKLSANPLIIILESVEKPGNIGAIMRTAYAAGVDAIIINDNQTDIFNPNIIRASEGHIFNNQVVVASVSETATWLKKNGIKSLAAATKKSNNYLEVDLTEPIALVFGSESDGLSAQWLKSANERILIPMKDGMDSLNVSVSAAIIVFEAIRQRNIS
ncbi:MAG: RNA methyltransferase [Patescibacteria group bacterium]